MPLIRVRPLGGGATRNEDMPDSPPVKQSKGMENDHEKDINGTQHQAVLSCDDCLDCCYGFCRDSLGDLFTM